MRVSFSGRMTASQAVNGSSIPPTRTYVKIPSRGFLHRCGLRWKSSVETHCSGLKSQNMIKFGVTTFEVNNLNLSIFFRRYANYK